MSDHLLWLDLETTGLDPDNDGILEVAWQVTEMNLFPVTEPRSCITGEHDSFSLMDETVWDIHQRSGLVEDIKKGEAVTLRDVEAMICRDLDGLPEGNVYLSGSGVHFDRAFIKVDMQRLDARLHYRHMDVSVVRRFFTDILACPLPDSGPVRHRALDDILAARRSMDELCDLVGDLTEL